MTEGLKEDEEHKIKQTKKGLRERIPRFLERIEKQDQYYEGHFIRLQEVFLKQSQEQISSYFKRARQEFVKVRKGLSKELTTLRYYSQHPEENHNLYPLFVQIDQKLIYNTNLIEESHLMVSLPMAESCDLDQQIMVKKLKLYDSYVRQLREVVESEGVRKYCKKEAQAGQNIIKMFTKMLENVKDTIYSHEVKLKKSLEEGVAELSRYKHVEKMSLSLFTKKGILSPSDYHQILDGLSQNKGFLGELNLKFMDMQFSQEKCDILRKRLSNEFKFIKSLSIQNYYAECKMGIFEDFNWQPYRKKVHITAGVW